MNSIEAPIVIAAMIVAFVVEARKTAVRRRKLKDRANRDFHKKEGISAAELRDRIGDLELMYENLESTYWMHVSALVALAAHVHWENWYLTIALFVGIAFLGSKFLSLRPFTTQIPD